MQVKDIINNGFTLLNPTTSLEGSITGIFTCDLLSHVMGNAKEGQVLITVLNNINVLGVASLMDLSAVIFSQNTAVKPEIIQKATELEIPLIQTKLSSADVVIDLHKLGV